MIDRNKIYLIVSCCCINIVQLWGADPHMRARTISRKFNDNYVPQLSRLLPDVKKELVAVRQTKPYLANEYEYVLNLIFSPRQDLGKIQLDLKQKEKEIYNFMTGAEKSQEISTIMQELTAAIDTAKQEKATLERQKDELISGLNNENKQLETTFARLQQEKRQQELAGGKTIKSIPDLQEEVTRLIDVNKTLLSDLMYRVEVNARESHDLPIAISQTSNELQEIQERLDESQKVEKRQANQINELKKE